MVSPLRRGTTTGREPAHPCTHPGKMWCFISSRTYLIVLPVRRRIHCGIGRFCFCALASFCFVRKDLWLYIRDHTLASCLFALISSGACRAGGRPGIEGRHHTAVAALSTYRHLDCCRGCRGRGLVWDVVEQRKRACAEVLCPHRCGVGDFVRNGLAPGGYHVIARSQGRLFPRSEGKRGWNRSCCKLEE